MACLTENELARVLDQGLTATPLVLHHVAACDDCRRNLAASTRQQCGLLDQVIAERFVLVRLIEEGAFGQVFEALDRELNRRVALKLFGRDSTPQASRAQLREAQAMASIVHDNIVPIYDVGQSGHGIYIAMQLIDGVTLQSWLADETNRSWRSVVSVMSDVAAGLQALHDAGLVHRDIKPLNIVVSKQRAYITDFGSAGPVAEASEDIGELPHPDVLDQFTRSQQYAGTPLYMAPELFSGASAGPTTDLYALGATMYEAFAGRRPWRAKTIDELCDQKRVGVTVDALARAKVPHRLRGVVQRATDPDPSRRYQAASEFAQALAPRARSLWLALGLVAVVAIVLLGGRYREIQQSGRIADCERSVPVAETWQQPLALARERLEARPTLTAPWRTAESTLQDFGTRLGAQRQSACYARYGESSVDAQHALVVLDCIRQRSALVHGYLALLAETPDNQLDSSAIAYASSVISTSCSAAEVSRFASPDSSIEEIRRRLDFMAVLDRIEQWAEFGQLERAQTRRQEFAASLPPEPQGLRTVELALVDAMIARHVGDTAAEERFAKLALANAQHADHVSRAIAWVFAYEAASLNNKQDAAELAETAAGQAVRESGLPTLRALFNYQKATNHAVRGEHVQAKALFQVARKAWVTSGDEAAVAGADLFAAHYAMSRNDMKLGERLLDMAEVSIKKWHGEDSAMFVRVVDARRLIAQNRHSPRAAVALGEKQLTHARRTQNREILFQALCGSAQSLQQAGENELALGRAREALAMGVPQKDSVAIECTTTLAATLAQLNQIEEALDILLRLLPVIRANPLPVNLSTFTSAAQLALVLGTPEKALTLTREALELGRALQHELMIITGSAMLGSLLVERGQLSEAYPLLKKSITGGMPKDGLYAWHLACWATVLRVRGETRPAMLAAQQAYELADCKTYFCTKARRRARNILGR